MQIAIANYKQGRYKKFIHKCNDVFLFNNLEPKLADGADFGKLWTEDREKALEYNKFELIQLEKIAKIIWGGK